MRFRAQPNIKNWTFRRNANGTCQRMSKNRIGTPRGSEAPHDAFVRMFVIALEFKRREQQATTGKLRDSYANCAPNSTREKHGFPLCVGRSGRHGWWLPTPRNGRALTKIAGSQHFVLEGRMP